MFFLKRTKHTFLFLIITLLSVFLASCSGSIESTLAKYPAWETETNAEGSSIRWEFEGKKLNYFNVIDGEDTFSQSFTFSIEGNTLTATSDYSTLTFKINIEGDTMTVKTETEQTLVFKRK